MNYYERPRSAPEIIIHINDAAVIYIQNPLGVFFCLSCIKYLYEIMMDIFAQVRVDEL